MCADDNVFCCLLVPSLGLTVVGFCISSVGYSCQTWWELFLRFEVFLMYYCVPFSCLMIVVFRCWYTGNLAQYLTFYIPIGITYILLMVFALVSSHVSSVFLNEMWLNHLSAFCCSIICRVFIFSPRHYLNTAQ